MPVLGEAAKAGAWCVGGVCDEAFWRLLCSEASGPAGGGAPLVCSVYPLCGNTAVLLGASVRAYRVGHMRARATPCSQRFWVLVTVLFPASTANVVWLLLVRRVCNNRLWWRW